MGARGSGPQGSTRASPRCRSAAPRYMEAACFHLEAALSYLGAAFCCLEAAPYSPEAQLLYPVPLFLLSSVVLSPERSAAPCFLAAAPCCLGAAPCYLEALVLYPDPFVFPLILNSPSRKQREQRLEQGARIGAMCFVLQGGVKLSIVHEREKCRMTLPCKRFLYWRTCREAVRERHRGVGLAHRKEVPFPFSARKENWTSWTAMLCSQRRRIQSTFSAGKRALLSLGGLWFNALQRGSPAGNLLLTRGSWEWSVRERQHYQLKGRMRYEQSTSPL